jgi:protein O-mannosyl-transferase
MKEVSRTKLFNQFSSPLVLALLLALFAFFFWCYTLSFEFLTFDDEIYITKNKVIADTSVPISELLQHKLGQRDYFPLSFLFWRGLNHLVGFNPVVFHLCNVLLHMANVVLVFLLSLRLFNGLTATDNRKKWFAVWVALAFAVHPLHVESVAWIIDLKDMLFSLFYLTGLLLYLKWGTTQKRHFYWLSLLAGTLSMFSKSVGVTFLGSLVLIDWLTNQSFKLNTIKRYWPFLLLTVVGFWLFGMLGNPFGILPDAPVVADAQKPYYPPFIYNLPDVLKLVFIASFRIFFWLKQFVFATGQTVFYPRNELLSQYSILILVFPILLMGALMVLFRFRKKNKLVFTGALFFIVSLSPALVQTDYTLATFVADRYMYLPLLGLLIMVVGFLMNTGARLRNVLLITILLVWTVIAIRYMPVWKTSLNLYDRALEIDESSIEPRLNRSALYLRSDDKEKGLADLNELISRYPNLETALLNRGVYYHLQKQYDLAFPDFEKVLHIKPQHFEGLMYRGIIHLKRNDLLLAHADFTKAYDMDSTHFVLNKNIASLYNKAENHAVALQFAEKALEHAADDTDLLRIKGVALYFGGKHREAIEILDRVIELKDEFAEVWFFRAKSFYELGNVVEAKLSTEKAIEKGFKVDPVFLEQLN